jgi:hypothetical protein
MMRIQREGPVQMEHGILRIVQSFVRHVSSLTQGRMESLIGDTDSRFGNVQLYFDRRSRGTEQ